MTASRQGHPTVRVRLFARYAELLGSEQIELPASSVSTAADVIAHIRSLPGGSGISATTLVAINMKQVAASDRVGPGDEVALLPPLAGG